MHIEMPLQNTCKALVGRKLRMNSPTRECPNDPRLSQEDHLRVPTTFDMPHLPHSSATKITTADHQVENPSREERRRRLQFAERNREEIGDHRHISRRMDSSTLSSHRLLHHPRGPLHLYKATLLRHLSSLGKRLVGRKLKIILGRRRSLLCLEQIPSMLMDEIEIEIGPENAAVAD
jgi:hypothetical protein